MTIVHKGSIPSTLNVTLRDEASHQTPFLGERETRARAVFFTDPHAENALNTAESWASSWPRSVKKPEVVLGVENRIMPSVLIVGSEQRSEGSRIWKVLLEAEGYGTGRLERWLVDLREDVFFATIMAGCEMVNRRGEGLRIVGDFRWVKLGSQVRLALMDSDLYRDLEACEEKKKAGPKPTLKPSTLEVGGLYLDRRGDYQFVNVECFLGKVTYDGKPGFAVAILGCVETPECDFSRLHCDPQTYLNQIREVMIQRSVRYTEKAGQLSAEVLLKRIQREGKQKNQEGTIALRDNWHTWPSHCVKWR